MAIKHRTFKKSRRRVASKNKKLIRKFLPLPTYRSALLLPSKKINFFTKPHHYARIKARHKPLKLLKKYRLTKKLRRRRPYQPNYLILHKTKKSRRFWFLLQNAASSSRRILFFKKYFYREKLFKKTIRQPLLSDWSNNFKRRQHLTRMSRLSENFWVIRNSQRTYLRKKSKITAPLKLYYNTPKIMRYWNRRAGLKVFCLYKGKIPHRRTFTKSSRLHVYIRKYKQRIFQIRRLRVKLKAQSEKWHHWLAKNKLYYWHVLKRFEKFAKAQQALLARRYCLRASANKRIYLYHLGVLKKLQQRKLRKVVNTVNRDYRQTQSWVGKSVKKRLKLKKVLTVSRRACSRRFLRAYLSRPRKTNKKQIKKIRHRKLRLKKAVSNKLPRKKITKIKSITPVVSVSTSGSLNNKFVKKKDFFMPPILPRKDTKFTPKNSASVRRFLVRNEDVVPPILVEPNTLRHNKRLVNSTQTKQKLLSLVFSDSRYFKSPNFTKTVASICRSRCLELKKPRLTDILDRPMPLFNDDYSLVTAVPAALPVIPVVVLATPPVPPAPTLPPGLSINDINNFRPNLPNAVWSKMGRLERQAHTKKKREIAAWKEQRDRLIYEANHTAFLQKNKINNFHYNNGKQ